MKKNIQEYKRVVRAACLVIFLLLGWSDRSSGQLLLPLQPEQDACNALVLCGHTFTTPYSYVGFGRIREAVPPIAEDNSMWMRLNVNTAGTIVFTISPINIFDDYDFAVFDITNRSCSAFSNSDAVRYNFKNNYGAPLNGITGLHDTATVHFVAGGSSFYPFCQYINANAGDVYLIMVNNWGSSGNGVSAGFTIDFAGSTATFNQPPAPEFSGVASSCNYQEVIVNLDQPVLCSSIAADGSDFSISPSGVVSGAEGIGCNGALGYTRQVKVSLATPLPNGSYLLNAQQGTDGNTLLSLCHRALVLPDTVGFSVDVDPLLYTSVDTPACQVLTVRLNRPVTCASIAANGSDFAVTGPSIVAVASASGAPGCVPGGTGGITSVIKVTLAQPIAVDGTYALVPRIGTDGNTLVDTCGKKQDLTDYFAFTVNSFNGKLRALPDTIICESSSDTVQLYGVNSGAAPTAGFTYRWLPASQVQDSASLQTLAYLTTDSRTFILETIDRFGCYLRDSARFDVAPAIEGEIFPEGPTICLGESVQLQGRGGISYTWFDNGAFNASENTTLSCHSCGNPTVTPVQDGSHVYYMIASGQSGCVDTVQRIVQVHPRPPVVVSPEEVNLSYGGTVQLNVSGALSYRWSPEYFLDDPVRENPVASYVMTPVDYVVYGTDENGCVDSAIVRVRLNGNFPDFMPNAFSPNGDGLNDVFRLSGVAFQELKEFRVFNRWGTCMFQTADINRGWDGFYNGVPAEAGTYFYTLILSYPDGSSRHYKGDVLLVR